MVFSQILFSKDGIYTFPTSEILEKWNFCRRAIKLILTKINLYEIKEIIYRTKLASVIAFHVFAFDNKFEFIIIISLQESLVRRERLGKSITGNVVAS